MTSRAFIYVIICFAGLTGTARGADESPDDIVVIANKGVAVDQITADELRDFFLKKRTNWSTGERVVPIHAPEDSPLRKTFTQKILELDSTKEKQYWQERMIVSGVEPPPSLKNNQKAVFRLKGAVSYVYRKDIISVAFKTLLVIPK